MTAEKQKKPLKKLPTTVEKTSDKPSGFFGSNQPSFKKVTFEMDVKNPDKSSASSAGKRISHIEDPVNV